MPKVYNMGHDGDWADPLFIDVAGGGLRLRKNSPARGMASKGRDAGMMAPPAGGE